MGGRIIGTTAEHPFWVEGRGWTKAIELRIGDVLHSDDGQRITVEGVADSGRVQTVYNFRVAEYHTYFVGSAEWGFSVWAHNADCSGELRLGGQQARDNLRSALGLVSDAGAPRAAHHLIPWRLRNRPVEGDIIEAAARGGFNINGIANGLALPHPHTIQIFNHSRYNDAVAGLIRQLPSGLSDVQYAS